MPGKVKKLFIGLSGFILPAVFWIAVWEICARLADSELLVTSPEATLARLGALASNLDFWVNAGASLYRIVVGYLAGIIVGLTLSFAARVKPARTLLAPFITVVKATPVASFILLALVWIKSDNVPQFISMLMVLPIVYGAVNSAADAVDPKLAEAARLFALRPAAKIKYLYFPAVLPQFSGACVTSLGLAWKAGIAAEIICTPKISIGRKLYETKVYLETPDLFAWTLSVILLSLLLESAVKFTLSKLTAGEVRDG
jgi:ABC-type nitrate/sulfonate/bicarbonate transport system, permease component